MCWKKHWGCLGTRAWLHPGLRGSILLTPVGHPEALPEAPPQGAGTPEGLPAQGRLLW